MTIHGKTIDVDGNGDVLVTIWGHRLLFDGGETLYGGFITNSSPYNVDYSRSRVFPPELSHRNGVNAIIRERYGLL